VIVVGQAALTDADGAAVLSQAMKAAELSDSRLMILHTAASRVGAMDVGAVTEGGIDACLDGAEVVFNLGADEVEIPPGAFVVYQGSHGDRGAHRADVIQPAAAWTEENGLFVNTEGRPQLSLRAGFAPGEAKENWAILRALSAELGATQPWDTLAALRRTLVAEVPHLGAVDEVPENRWTPLPPARPATGAFATAVTDFYLTNPIARASALMGELSRAAAARTMGKIAAE
jgi:NADH-quinone oxidoreductase subunit G